MLFFYLWIYYISFYKKRSPEEISPEKAAFMSYFFFIGLILIVLGGHLMVTHALTLQDSMVFRLGILTS